MAALWEVRIVNLDTGEEYALPNPQDMAWNDDLFDTSTFSCTVLGDANSIQYVQPLINDMKIYRDGEHYATYLVKSTPISVEDDQFKMQVQGVSYKERLDHRIVLAADTTPTATGTLDYNTDAVNIVNNLLTLAQSRVNGNMGLTMSPTNPTTTAVRNRKYPNGQSIGEAIDKLGRGDQNDSGDDNFEWDVNEFKQIVIAPGHFDRSHGDPQFTFSYPGNLSAWHQEDNVDNYANMIDIVGKDNAFPQEAFDSEYESLAQGAYEVYVADDTLGSTGATLNKALSLLGSNYSIMLPSYTFTLRQNEWQGRAYLQKGDTVRVKINIGEYNIDRSDLRIISIGVAIDENGNESVTLVVGYKLRNITEKLTQLTRTTNLKIDANVRYRALVAKRAADAKKKADAAKKLAEKARKAKIAKAKREAKKKVTAAHRKALAAAKKKAALAKKKKIGGH